MPWRPKAPSPTWRSFLHNHLTDIAAIDRFVVATATFQLLYALIVLSHDRRRIIHFAVIYNPTQVWLAQQMTEAFPWDTAPRHLLRDRDASYGPVFRDRVREVEEDARANQRGLWQGAFIAPWDWRHRKNKTVILGVLSVPIDAQNSDKAPQPP
jgi:putative transposase